MTQPGYDPRTDPRYAQPQQDQYQQQNYAQQPPAQQPPAQQPPAQQPSAQQPPPGYDPRYAQDRPAYAPAPPQDPGYGQAPQQAYAQPPQGGYQGMPVQGYYNGPPQGGYQGMPQQGNPWQGNPYAAPELRNQGYQGQQQQRPAPVQGDLDSFFNQPSGGARSIASFLHKQVGQSITGVVARPITDADITQQTDFTSGKGLEFRDGRAKFQMVVPLVVQASIEFPDERASWYVRGSERDELAAAMARAGAPPGPPEMGAIITITYVGERQIPNLNAKKLHNIVYRRPDGTGIPSGQAPDGQQAQAPQAPPPAQPVPAPAAQQPQMQQDQHPQYQQQAPQGFQQQGPPQYQQGPPPGGYALQSPPADYGYAQQGYQQPPQAQQLPGQPPAPAGQAVQNAAPSQQQPQYQQQQPAPPAPLPPGVTQEDVSGMNAEQLALISKLAAQQVSMQPQPQ